jgi:hypothetical protein
VEKEIVPAFHAASRFEIPLGSGTGGSDQDEIVSRFAASCPGGSLEHMAGMPSDVLVSKGVAILAEVRKKKKELPFLYFIYLSALI